MKKAQGIYDDGVGGGEDPKDAVRSVLLAFASAVVLATFGGEVTAERAVNATSAWIARSPAPSRLPTGDVRTFSMNGTNAFHLVALRGGGWTAMPADDAYEPVIAFNPDAGAAIPDEDDGNPTWDAIANYVDMGAFEEGEREVWGVNDRPRFSVSATVVSSAATATSKGMRALTAKSGILQGLTWKSLDADTAGASAWKKSAPLLRVVVQYEGVPADVCVAPLSKTKWNQSGVNGEPCYNYYVPNYYPCGCVATAMAQVMYHYKWPLTQMPTGKFAVTVDDEPMNFAMERGTTGCFRWDSMVPCPSEAESLSEENRTAIGMLTYNCGLAVKMQYKGSGSGAWSEDAASAFKNSFNYANADYVVVERYNPSPALKCGLLPCLDAAVPCFTEVKGHAVVSDGYAFSEGCLFVHMNMGWGGHNDAYYRQSLIEHKRTILSAICNVSTNDVPRYASGRVTDALGNPVEGATVRASIPAYGGYAATEQTVSTDSRGVYAVRVQSGSYNISISAAKEGFLALQEPCTAKISTSSKGNSWGNDFVLVNRDDMVEWIGEGDGTMFGDPANWSCGRVPGNDDVIAFGAATPAFVTNDIPDFAPASVVFLQECPKVEIGGLAIQGVVAMASSAAERPVFATEVAFADTIDVSGAIEFKGGVQGTYPVSHDVYYGDYHLTTEDWWHPPPLRPFLPGQGSLCRITKALPLSLLSLRRAARLSLITP